MNQERKQNKMVLEQCLDVITGWDGNTSTIEKWLSNRRNVAKHVYNRRNKKR